MTIHVLLGLEVEPVNATRYDGSAGILPATPGEIPLRGYSPGQSPPIVPKIFSERGVCSQ
jgi:hypothetical protein